MTPDDRTHDNLQGTSPADHGPATHYEIRVQGHLGSRWAAWFDGFSLTNEADGITVIRGPVADQAALHGVFQKLRDVGVPLLSLVPLPTDTPEAAPRARLDQEGTSR